MSISTYAAYAAKLIAPIHRFELTRNAGFTQSQHRMSSDWGILGATPTASVVPDKSTTGAINRYLTGGSFRLLETRFNTFSSAFWTAMFMDRLVHSAGLSGTVTTAQTTNLPSAALTRETSGVGVQAYLEIYTQIGATGTTFTCSYTNSAGVSGRTSPLQVIGGTGYRELARMLLMPLQVGDVGVRSVESVTLTATTGTAGNFGVTLVKPLLIMPIGCLTTDVRVFFGPLYSGGFMPLIDANACLQLGTWANSTSAGSLFGQMTFAED